MIDGATKGMLFLATQTPTTMPAEGFMSCGGAKRKSSVKTMLIKKPEVLGAWEGSGLASVFGQSREKLVSYRVQILDFIPESPTFVCIIPQGIHVISTTGGHNPFVEGRS